MRKTLIALALLLLSATPAAAHFRSFGSVGFSRGFYGFNNGFYGGTRFAATGYGFSGYSGGFGYGSGYGGYAYPAAIGFALPVSTYNVYPVTAYAAAPTAAYAAPACAPAYAQPGYSPPTPAAAPPAAYGYGAAPLPALAPSVVTYLQSVPYSQRVTFLNSVYGSSIANRLFIRHAGVFGSSVVVRAPGVSVFTGGFVGTTITTRAGIGRRSVIRVRARGRF
jgi:hypothetical protein